MSYEHCDKHDEDATNGCKECMREAETLAILDAFDEWAVDRQNVEAHDLGTFEAGWRAGRDYVP